MPTSWRGWNLQARALACTCHGALAPALQPLPKTRLFIQQGSCRSDERTGCLVHLD